MVKHLGIETEEVLEAENAGALALETVPTDEVHAPRTAPVGGMHMHNLDLMMDCCILHSLHSLCVVGYLLIDYIFVSIFQPF